MKQPSIPKISAQHLRVLNFDGLSDFYCGLLGMQEVKTEKNLRAFGFSADQCSVVFHQTEVAPYQPQANDFYWKIGVTLRDLDAAVGYLRDRGLTLPDPYQFRDIGYMSKLTDPKGLSIELLQQGFEGNAKSLPDGHPVGTQATLAHITLRVTDIATAKSYFEETLGMRLMSVQPVEDFGFCLYFYTWSDEPLPEPELTSVSNREWLWSRPYTFIELQHLEKPGLSVNKSTFSDSGFEGFCYHPKTSDKPIFVHVSDLSHLS
ncbi:MAG: VOC family protein [Halopseudomonas aestusnigri]